MRVYLDAQHNFEANSSTASDALLKVADDNRVHPVREYLGGRSWDGVPRLASLFPTYFCTDDNQYTRYVGTMMLVAAVARIFEPGIKYDFVVILEGEQGTKKSTAIAVLAVHHSWYAELTGDLANKDSVDLLQGNWLVEVAELHSMTKSNIDITKAFLSRQHDKVRLAYAKRTEEFPRQCIFIGTTNQKKYLRDTTGNRRFLPIKTGKINIDLLEADRDQLWAEAVHIYKSGQFKLYITDPVIQAMAEASRTGCELQYAWQEKVEKWLSEKGVKKISTAELFTDCLGIPESGKSDSDCKQLASVMSSLSWHGTNINVSGKTLKGYEKWGS